MNSLAYRLPEVEADDDLIGALGGGVGEGSAPAREKPDLVELVSRELLKRPRFPRDQWHDILKRMPHKDLRKLADAELG